MGLFAAIKRFIDKSKVIRKQNEILKKLKAIEVEMDEVGEKIFKNMDLKLEELINRKLFGGPNQVLLDQIDSDHTTLTNRFNTLKQEVEDQHKNLETLLAPYWGKQA